MNSNTLIALLLVYIVVREVFFLYSTHKMINKIMSHNFHDYQQSASLSKVNQTPQTMPATEEHPEDLGSLDGFGIM